MKRLVRKADEITDVQKLLKRIDSASHDLKDTYYVLFDNLNALYEAYPNLYKEIQMVVKLPSNDDAKNIVQFNKDLHNILDHLSDKQYLNSYVNPAPDPNKEEDSLLDEPDSSETDPEFDKKVDQKFDQSIDQGIGTEEDVENK